MTLCNLCDVKIDNKSYFLRMEESFPNKSIFMGYIIEVCPECHHFFVYGTEEQKQKYKERRNIK